MAAVSNCGGSAGGCAGACAGVEPVTPQSIANPPGQSFLCYRVGTHAAFLETMQARLSAFPGTAGLTARDPTDMSVAVLDGWACIADVLSFYQERIANEGFLRTAAERYSLQEIGRLVGYKPRPGVSASAFLAYQMEIGYRGIIPAGTRAQSLPSQNQLPQAFETSEPLEARSEWNDLAPRRLRPQRLDENNAFYIGVVYLEGIALQLKAGDPLLLVWGNKRNEQVFRRVASVDTNTERGTTRVGLATHLSAAQFFTALRDMAQTTLPEWAAAGPNYAQWQQDLVRLTGLLNDLLEVSADDGTEEGSKKQRDAGLNYLTFLDELDENRKQETVTQAPPGRDALLDELIRLYKSLDPRFRAERGFSHFFQTQTAKPKAPQNTLLLLSKFTPPASPSGASAAAAARFGGLQKAPRKEGGSQNEAVSRLMGNFAGHDKENFFAAFAQVGTFAAADAASANANGDDGPAPLPLPAQVFALRITAALFGHNAPPRLRVQENGELLPIPGERPLEGDDAGERGQTTLFLEREFPELLPNDWAVVETDPFREAFNQREGANRASNDVVNEGESTASGDGLRPEGDDPNDDGLRITRIGRMNNGISRSAYNLSGKTTVLTVARPDAPGQALWWRRPVYAQPKLLPTGLIVDDQKSEARHAKFADLRRTVVYSKSQALTLAQEPITAPVSGDTLVLNAVYEGLTPGRRIIVAGERADLFGAQNIRAAEIALVAGVEQKPDPFRASDKPTTIITLVYPLGFSYKRQSALVYGNVAHATHGETRNEIVGSGDASAEMQRFTLRQKPLTYVSSPTPSGIESTLHLFVDDVQWHEAPDLNDAARDGRVFVTTSDETGETTLYFGDGKRGARLPTGQDNVRATYRTGTGRGGNVASGAISQLATRPLGVKAVVNPTASSGGTDAETTQTMRQHIPLSLASLERLVSQNDYAAFARVFAGVGKASAARLTNGRRSLLQVTLAADDDGFLDTGGDLFRNLKTALRQFGDPTVALSLRVRDKIVPVVGAKIKVLGDYSWDTVAPAVQAALWAEFSFARRDLGQTLFPAEVLSVIQAVPGVDYVDLDTLVGLAQSETADPEKLQAFLDRLQPQTLDPKAASPQPLLVLPDREDGGKLLPAQIAYLDSNLPETLLLSQIG